MKLKVQAQSLQPGDIVGSGEKVEMVSSGIKTPKGKVNVRLVRADLMDWRWATWGKYTMINVERKDD